MAIVLHVQGMNCGHCVAAITSAVQQVPGATGVDVDLGRGVVTVSGTPDVQAVATAIEDSGYDIDAAQSA